MLRVKVIDKNGQFEFKPKKVNKEDGIVVYDFNGVYYDIISFVYIHEEYNELSNDIELRGINCYKMMVKMDDLSPFVIFKDVKHIEYMLSNHFVSMNNEQQKHIHMIIGDTSLSQCEHQNFVDYNPTQGNFILFEGNLFSLKHNLIITKKFELLNGISDKVRNRLNRLIQDSIMIYI